MLGLFATGLFPTRWSIVAAALPDLAPLVQEIASPLKPIFDSKIGIELKTLPNVPIFLAFDFCDREV